MTTLTELARELSFAQVSDLRAFAPDDITNDMGDGDEIPARVADMIRAAAKAAPTDLWEGQSY